MPIVNVNSIDTDQKPRSVASELGLQCSPITHYGVNRLKLVNVYHTLSHQ